MPYRPRGDLLQTMPYSLLRRLMVWVANLSLECSQLGTDWAHRQGHMVWAYDPWTAWIYLGFYPPPYGFPVILIWWSIPVQIYDPSSWQGSCYTLWVVLICLFHFFFSFNCTNINTKYKFSYQAEAEDLTGNCRLFFNMLIAVLSLFATHKCFASISMFS